MKIRVKKQEFGILNRIESLGEIKEILINQDFLNPRNVSVSLCFRGKNNSGIIDLSPQEFEMINKEILKKKALLKKVKVIKFKK